MRVRAKFRCMSVRESQSGEADAEYLPVMPKSCEDNGSAENEMFWRYTPSGDASRHILQGQPRPAPGSFWYIDMTPDAKGEWHLEGVRLMGPESFEIELRHYGHDRGAVNMHIENPDLYEFFVAQGRSEERRWAVVFSATDHDPDAHPHV